MYNLKLIDKDVLTNAAQSFTNAQPFKHIVIDDFLSEEACRKMMEQFPEPEYKEMLNEY